MPFVPKVAAKCPKCKTSVFAAEERVAGGNKYHVGCFVCEMCKKRLDSGTVSERDEKLFCKQCYGRKFGPKGYGFGQGAGTLGMDSGEQFGNKESEMSNVPTGNAMNGSAPPAVSNGTPAPGSGSKPAPSGNGCLRCGKAVYHAEKAIGTSKSFHKTCFSCQDCKKKLDSSTMAMHENDLYCKGCHGKHFGPTGYGFGQGSGTLSMHQ